MSKKKLTIPHFKNEEAEREFWDSNDLTEYFATGDFTKSSFPNLKPTSRSVSMRLPEFLIARLKEKANELNISYQSLIKKYIAKGLVTD